MIPQSSDVVSIAAYDNDIYVGTESAIFKCNINNNSQCSIFKTFQKASEIRIAIAENILAILVHQEKNKKMEVNFSHFDLQANMAVQNSAIQSSFVFRNLHILPTHRTETPFLATAIHRTNNRGDEIMYFSAGKVTPCEAGEQQDARGLVPFSADGGPVSIFTGDSRYWSSKRCNPRIFAHRNIMLNRYYFTFLLLSTSSCLFFDNSSSAENNGDLNNNNGPVFNNPEPDSRPPLSKTIAKMALF